jgi:hypothetical protein
MTPRPTRAHLVGGIFLTFLSMAIPPVITAQGAPAWTPDKGGLRILQNGAEVGTERFEVSRSEDGWIARGETLTRVPGSPEARSSGELRLKADTSAARYEWRAQAALKASGVVEFEGKTLRTSITLDGKEPALQDFTFPEAGVVILDNNLYHQYGVLARRYNWTAKGAQSFPVYIPQDSIPGSITAESIGSKAVNGTQANVLSVRTADLELHVYVDSQLRLLRIEVPEAKVVVTRE